MGAEGHPTVADELNGTLPCLGVENVPFYEDSVSKDPAFGLNRSFPLRSLL